MFWSEARQKETESKIRFLLGQGVIRHVQNPLVTLGCAQILCRCAIWYMPEIGVYSVLIRQIPWRPPLHWSTRSYLPGSQNPTSTLDSLTRSEPLVPFLALEGLDMVLVLDLLSLQCRVSTSRKTILALILNIFTLKEVASLVSPLFHVSCSVLLNPLIDDEPLYAKYVSTRFVSLALHSRPVPVTLTNGLAIRTGVG